MAHDALGAHARDELGISAAFRARPIQAALASAASFVAGAAMPLAVTAVAPHGGSDPGCLRDFACCSWRFWEGWRRAPGARA